VERAARAGEVLICIKFGQLETQ